LIRLKTAAALFLASAVLVGCGGNNRQQLPADYFRQSIPGAPAATPMWLSKMAWHEAVGLGDPHPEKIAVTLGVVDRYGRVLGRVWMRGHFTCGDCTGPGVLMPAHGRHAGFTVTVIVKSRHMLSFSFRH
jgi:hypothetical protein